jgi:hypothetical protein
MCRHLLHWMGEEGAVAKGVQPSEAGSSTIQAEGMQPELKALMVVVGLHVSLAIDSGNLPRHVAGAYNRFATANPEMLLATAAQAYAASPWAVSMPAWQAGCTPRMTSPWCRCWRRARQQSRTATAQCG